MEQEEEKTGNVQYSDKI